MKTRNLIGFDLVILIETEIPAKSSVHEVDVLTFKQPFIHEIIEEVDVLFNTMRNAIMMNKPFEEV